MAVDRNGALYVAVTSTSGPLVPVLVRVDPTTMECEVTSFGPVGIAATPELDVIRGMAFVQDRTHTGESLYFIGDATRAGQPWFLGVTDATTLQWQLVGTLGAWGSLGLPLTGRAQLYLEAQASIDAVDTATAGLTVLWNIPASADDPPFTLWAGAYYTFTNFLPGPVTRFRPQDGSSVQVATTTSTVLGAATSTCAP